MPASYRTQGFDENVSLVQLHNLHLVHLLLPKDQLPLHPWDHLEYGQLVHERVLPLVQADHLVEVLLLEALNYLMRNVVVPIDWQVPLSAESVLHVFMAVHMGFA